MRLFVILCGFIVFLSCKNPAVSESDLSYLNGYWEINAVLFPDGVQKEYTINPTIDFFHLKDGKGFRRKLTPKPDGTYNTSRNMTFFEVKSEQNGFTLKYRNKNNVWREKLVQLDSTSLSMLGNDGVMYSYRRFSPILSLE